MGIRDEMLKLEMVEGLQRALDRNFERVREDARRQWEARFGGTDPSDVCVNVRISAAAQARLSVVPAAGILARKALARSGKMQPLLV
ncbi:MAG: hypothetical protein ABR514_02225 [Chthoniobacterales bacterium]